MSGGGDGAYKQFIRNKPSEISALHHGNHSAFSTRIPPDGILPYLGFIFMTA
jgi:hypothetical protein